MPNVTPTDAYVVALAKARVYADAGGKHITLTTTNSTVDDATSGDLVLVDNLAGVALADYDAVNDEVVLDIAGVHNMSVKGAGSAGNAKVSIGDVICYDDGELNKDDQNGIWVGIALGEVSAGATATIPVKVIPGFPAIGRIVNSIGT